MEYQIAIPTHRRPDILRDQTLATLAEGGADMSRVKLFLSDAEDAELYRTFPNHVITGAKNVTEKFNAIHGHYQEGTRVFVMEDDVRLVQGSGKKNDGRPVEDVEEMIRKGFEAVGDEGLWGVVPHDNAFYFGGQVTETLKLIVAHAFGFVATGDPWLAVTQIGKSDYERTCRYWVKYRRVVRLDTYGVKTKSYTQVGGMQSDMDKDQRRAAEAKSCEYLLQRFPHLLASKVKKTSPFPELRFQACKYDRDSLREYQYAICKMYGDDVGP